MPVPRCGRRTGRPAVTKPGTLPDPRVNPGFYGLSARQRGVGPVGVMGPLARDGFDRLNQC